MCKFWVVTFGEECGFLKVVINECFHQRNLLLGFIEIIKYVGFEAITLSGIQQKTDND